MWCTDKVTQMKVGLQITAELENVASLHAAGEDFRWYLKLKCLQCGSETPEFVYVDLLNSQPLKGGRGSASLVIKCKLCRRENSIDIIKESLCAYFADDMPQFKTVVVFDCRGVEPTDFEPRAGWAAQAQGSQSSTRFEDIDLSPGEWADYDENAEQSVSIYELKHQFVKQ